MHRAVPTDFHVLLPVVSNAVFLLSLLVNMPWAALRSHGDYFLLGQQNPSVGLKQNPTETRGEADVEFRGSAFVFTGGLLHLLTFEMQYTCN